MFLIILKRYLPFEVELQVPEDATAWQKHAAHAGEDVPAVQIAGAPWAGHFGCLFDQLAIKLISQGP